MKLQTTYIYIVQIICAHDEYDNHSNILIWIGIIRGTDELPKFPVELFEDINENYVNLFILRQKNRQFLKYVLSLCPCFCCCWKWNKYIFFAIFRNVYFECKTELEWILEWMNKVRHPLPLQVTQFICLQFIFLAKVQNRKNISSGCW